MIIEAGDLGVIVDTGLNRPGDPLQRLEAGQWRDFEQDGELVRWPVKLETLPPGQYRVSGTDLFTYTVRHGRN